MGKRIGVVLGVNSHINEGNAPRNAMHKTRDTRDYTTTLHHYTQTYVTNYTTVQ